MFFISMPFPSYRLIRNDEGWLGGAKGGSEFEYIQQAEIDGTDPQVGLGWKSGNPRDSNVMLCI